MYKNFYLQASQMADMIRSGEYKKHRQAKSAAGERMRQGLVSRREQAMEEGPAFDPVEMASAYISEIRSDALPQMMPEDEPISTRALTTDDGKPASVWEIDTSLKGLDSSELTDLIDLTEGGGDYNTLFGFSNREGKEFGGINISEMTIGELKEFTNPNGEYAQYVKRNNPEGVVATPLGRYQFVGSTMAEIADKMGLSDDTVFSPEVQDSMFAFKTSELLRNETDMKRMRNKMRSTWVGFKGVDNQTLDQAIQSFLTTASMSRPE